MQPFLTIGIPTWNRHTYLKQNIESLVVQIKRAGLDDTVELLIADNASTDGTEAMCREVAINNHFVTYKRHDQNCGANANFQYVIEAANGEYVWLLGDDDLLVDDIIQRVMNDIRMNQPDVIVGPAVYDQTKEKATHHAYHHVLLGNRELLMNEDIILLAGKMSGLIFKRASVLPHIPHAETIITATRTPWPHLVWFLLVLNHPDKKILVLPYGINQLVAANWHNLLFDGKTLIKILFIDYQALLLALKSDLDQHFYQRLMARSVTTRQASLLKCVLYGTYLDKSIELFKVALLGAGRIKGLKNSLNYFAFLIMPLLLPGIIRKTAYSLVKIKWPKMRLTLERIHSAKALMSGNVSHDQRAYNSEDL